MSMQYNKTLTSVTLTASLLTDPSIASKYIGLPPGPYSFAVIFLVFFQIVFLLSRRRFRVHREIAYLAVAFLLYALISLTYRFLAGQNIGDFFLHALTIANFFFLLLLLTDEAWRGTFVTAIYIAGAAHCVSLLPDPLGFRANLIAATAYDIGTGGLSELFRRETGLFPAPAMLVAFAILLFVTGLLNFLSRRSSFWSVLCIGMAIALGLATFNRSFLLALTWALLVLSWCYRVRTRLLLIYFIMTITLMVLPLEEYIVFVSGRLVMLFEGGLDASQRWTGSTGIVTGLNIIADRPFFGSPIAPNGGTMQAIGDQQQVVNPHNGWIQALAIYGFIGGAPFLALYVWSFGRVLHVLAGRRYFWGRLIQAKSLADSQMYFSAISISLMAILMVEPLGEYSFIFMLSISPLLTRLPVHSPISSI